MTDDYNEIIDLTNELGTGKPMIRTKTFGFLGTLNTNVYFRQGDPEEEKYKQFLIQRAGRIFSERNIRNCLQFRGDVYNPEISIKTVLERGTKRHQLHLHCTIKFTVPIKAGQIRIDYHKFNETVQEILELDGARVFWVPFIDNAKNTEQYIMKHAE